MPLKKINKSRNRTTSKRSKKLRHKNRKLTKKQSRNQLKNQSRNKNKNNKNRRSQSGGADCNIATIKEPAFNIPGLGDIAGLNIAESKAVIYNPNCKTDTYHPMMV